MNTTILVVTEVFTLGGLETHVRGQFKALSRKGCAMHLSVCGQSEDWNIPSEAMTVVTGLGFGPTASLGDLVSTVESLRALIREHGVDCVHAHPFHAQLPAFIAAEMERVPFVTTLHGPASFAEYHGPVYDFVIKSVVLPNASLTFAVSPEVAALAMPHVHEERLRLLPNGVAMPKLEATRSTIDPRWLVVSRLDEFKIVGIVDMIRKAASVCGASFLIVGDGASREACQCMIAENGLADRVEFYGGTPDAAEMMPRFAVVAGMGRVVLEGLAAGRPVILTGYDGVKGLIDEAAFEQAKICNFSGRNLQTIEVEAFADQIRCLDEYTGYALRELVNERFGESVIWDRYLIDIDRADIVNGTVLGLAYREILESGLASDEPYLRSHVFMDKIKDAFGKMLDVDFDIMRVFMQQEELLVAINSCDSEANHVGQHSDDAYTQDQNLREEIQGEATDKECEDDTLNDDLGDHNHEEKIDVSNPETCIEPSIFKVLQAEMDINEPRVDAQDLGVVVAGNEMTDSVPPFAMVMDKLRESESRVERLENDLRAMDAYIEDKEIYIAQLCARLGEYDRGLPGVAIKSCDSEANHVGQHSDDAYTQDQNLREEIQGESTDKECEDDTLNDDLGDHNHEETIDVSNPEICIEPSIFKVQEVDVNPFAQEVDKCSVVMAEMDTNDPRVDAQDLGVVVAGNEMTDNVPPVSMVMEKLRESESRVERLENGLRAMDAYIEDKEIYIAQLCARLGEYDRGLPGVALKVQRQAHRAAFYGRKAIGLLRSSGFKGLAKAVYRKVRGVRGGLQYTYLQPSLHGSTNDHEFSKGAFHGISPVLCDELVIISGVPFDDVGGGQRSAQLARCALKSGRKVVYVYIYKKFDFELRRHVDSEVNIPGMCHVHIGDTNPLEIMKMISGEATVLIEHPHPAALPYLQICNARGLRTVFELIDDWETSLGGDWFDIECYRKIVEQSKVVVGTARVLVKRLQNMGRMDAIYLPNAANEYIFDKYKEYRKPVDLPYGYKHVALYFGSLYGEWFAWDYLFEAAAGNPDTAFVLIGELPEGKSLPDNVHAIGRKNIEELPAYLAYADMGLLPFVPGQISDAVSPIKVFEYLFSGTPVVSTRLPELDGYPGVSVAHSPEEFTNLCSSVMTVGVASADNDLFISRNSWFSRLDAIVGNEKCQKFKESVSVVILIHNNKQIIGRCLETLLSHCFFYLKEVIVVDNASADGGDEYVERRFPTVKLIHNTENGCSSGRNLGAQHASGRFIAFFDSDQWFTSSSAFAEALRILDRDANIGAVGWGGGWFDATRSDLTGKIVDYIPNRAMNAAAIARGYRSDIGYLGTCGMFMLRSVFDNTDGFDVAYDPTCFEDTDLSFQIKRLGLDVCYRDLCGIRHQPHQTTCANSNSDKYKNLFDRNAKYFKQKWSEFQHFFVDYTE